MEVPRKKAKTCSNDTEDDGASTLTAAQQIAELQAELERCKRDKTATEERHNKAVQDLKALKASYSDALEWAYSVKSIPHGHWLAKSHTVEFAEPVEYADEIVRLLNAFKLDIKDLRMGTVGECFEVEFDLQDEVGRTVTAAHDDLLMPYWKELANALVHWSEYHAGEETLELSIAHIETPDAVLDVLRPAVKQSKVKSVCFTGVAPNQTWNLAEFVEDVIQTNHNVTEVELGYYIRFSTEEWMRICDAVKTRNAQQSSIMSYFGLRQCFAMGINTEVLKGVLACNIMEIHLGYNGMSSREASIIAEFLNSNPSLRLLSLEGNFFDDNEAAVLANSLSSNTHLRTLHVEKNEYIEEEGRLAFLRATFDVTSLASCGASNHTCNVYGLEQDISALNGYFESSVNKWEKIFAMLALSCEDSFINAALLSGVPASLMPALLDEADCQEEKGNSQITDLYLELTDTKRRQKHDVWDNLGNTKPLNCVYGLMRCWVVPSIFA